MQNLWIKICGITRNQDASSAVSLGADAIGMVFYAPSSRAVSPADAADIAGGLIEKALVIALFVDPSRALVNSVIETGAVNCLQFHGNESPEFCQSFAMPYIKAFRVGQSDDLLSDIKKYSSADYILLDSFDPNIAGGTGKSFDWSLAADLVAQLDVKLVLAGGLDSENISAAVEIVAPFGVDVSSGVEAGKGIKDLDKMKKFILGARAGV